MAPVLLVYVARQDSRDRGETQVNQDSLVHVVSLAHLVALAQVVRMDSQDSVDGPELLDLLDQRVH